MDRRAVFNEYSPQSTPRPRGRVERRSSNVESRQSAVPNPQSAIWLCTCLLALSPATGSGDDALALMRAHQRSFRQAVQRAAPCVVRIETLGGAQPRPGGPLPTPTESIDDGSPPPETENTPFRDTLGSSFLVADGPTTGIIYESDGWILTSSFNFVREPAHITVHLADGRPFVAQLIARDKVRKLALLRIDASGLPTPEWARSPDIRVGQWTIALGRGFGGETPSVTVGIVSALNRMMRNAVQTDAKLSPANYGGPLIDLQGRILGICVPMAQRPGELAGVEFYDAGIGFAVPFERVTEIVADMKTGKSFYRGWLGISINVRARDRCQIRAVADPSPVRELGIQAGDVVTHANGRPIRRFDGLVQAIYMVPAGEIVQLGIDRNDLSYGYEVRLARAGDLGPLVQNEVPFDPENPFTIPKKKPWE